MWNQVRLSNKTIGHEFKTKKSIIFFGNANILDTDIMHIYKEFEFCSLNQVHKTDVVEAQTKYSLNADAHYTSSKKRALLIKTADCIPVMIEDGFNVYSIHAGWRGLVAGIINKAISLCHLSKDSKIFIGPHIHKENFEVGSDVFPLFETFINGFSGSPTSEEFYTIKNNKYLVDLNHLLKKQLLALKVNPENIFDININTFADLNYHSYRRDKNDSGRQYSFIAQI